VSVVPGHRVGELVTMGVEVEVEGQICSSGWQRGPS